MWAFCLPVQFYSIGHGIIFACSTNGPCNGQGFFIMANKTVTTIDTMQGEVEREEYLFMMDCFDACEEAKQNEGMIMAGLKTMPLSEVWAKYTSLMFGQ